MDLIIRWSLTLKIDSATWAFHKIDMLHQAIFEVISRGRGSLVQGWRNLFQTQFLYPLGNQSPQCGCPALKLCGITVAFYPRTRKDSWLGFICVWSNFARSFFILNYGYLCLWFQIRFLIWSIFGLLELYLEKNCIVGLRPLFFFFYNSWIRHWNSLF